MPVAVVVQMPIGMHMDTMPKEMVEVMLGVMVAPGMWRHKLARPIPEVVVVVETIPAVPTVAPV
mgnify:CR=1 FL=1